MKKKLYLGQGNGERELKQAWLDVYKQSIANKELQFFLNQPKGTILPIRSGNKEQTVYWVAIGKSKSICKQAWADFWPLLGDSILQWDIMEIDREG